MTTVITVLPTEYSILYIECMPFSVLNYLHFNGHFPGEPGLASVY